MRWRPKSLAALAACFVVLGGLAIAAPPDQTSSDALDRTIEYFERQQNMDGGWGGEAGKASDPGISAWVAFALAAASVNPQDQARVGGVDAFSYLSAHTDELSVTTDWERVLLVAFASCTSPHDFGGTDPVARILERQLPDGSFPHAADDTAGGVNDTAFAILALSPHDEPAIRAAITKAADWLLTVQQRDGSWGWSPLYGSRSTDMTGAVIQALRAAGRPGTEAERRGFAYLRSLQNDDGGFPQVSATEVPNVASTAWAVQAMWAAGIDPRTWSAADPLNYLAARQRPDGSIQYQAGKSENDLWMTAEVSPAFAGRQLPVPCVAPAIHPRNTPTPTATATPTGTPSASTGQDGRGGQASPGAISGGGGEGAPLFSKPQPQSRGRTAGGDRETDPKRGRSETRAAATPVARARTTPVPVTVQPTATPTPTATPGPGGGAKAKGLSETSDGSGGGGALPYVTGTLVSNGSGALAAAAPGIRAAGAGGENDGIALAIALALAAAALTGWRLETRR